MFYEELKQEIERLLAKHQFQKALSLINQELEAPYVPRDMETFLLERQKQAQFSLQKTQKPKSTGVGLNEIKKMLKAKDSMIHLIAIDAFENINVRLLDKELNDFLLRQDVKNDVKSLVLITLHKQDLNQNFNVWHNNQFLTINPKNLDINQLSTFNHQVVNKLKTLFFLHNQSLTNLAIKIALLFLLDFFPENFYFTVNDVVAMAIKRAGKMLNEAITWNQIHEHLKFDLAIAKKIFNHQLPSLD